MEFKQLELKSDTSKIKKIIQSKRVKKSLLYVIIGASAGFLFFYITEGRHLAEITSGDVLNSVLIGGFLGFFITNSPCARGRC